jgi:hypothetical protein
MLAREGSAGTAVRFESATAHRFWRDVKIDRPEARPTFQRRRMSREFIH